MIRYHLIKKKKNSRIIALMLAFSLIITGAMAYLTATDQKNNVFNLGNVNALLHERFDGVEYKTKNVDPPAMQNMLPGQTVEKKPWVENTGDIDEWVYMLVGVPVVPKSDIASDTNGVAVEGQTYQIPIQTFVFQDGYKENTTLQTIWDAFGYDIPGEEIVDPVDYIRLFSLNNLNLTDWTAVSTPKLISANDTTMVYYVYGYNNKLEAEDETNPLFESVTLTNLIGENGNYLYEIDGNVIVGTIPITYSYDGSSEYVTSSQVVDLLQMDGISGWRSQIGAVYTDKAPVMELVSVVDNQVVDPDPKVYTVREAVQPEPTGSVWLVGKNPNLGNADCDHTAIIDRSDWTITGLYEMMLEEQNGNDPGLSNYIEVACSPGHTGYYTVDYSKISSHYYGSIGTGVIVHVFDENGTIGNRSDDIETESFSVVIYGDTNGDAHSELNDSTDIQTEISRINGTTSGNPWSIPSSPNYRYEKLKAGDLNKNGRIDQSDYHFSHANGVSFDIDQTNGCLPNWYACAHCGRALYIDFDQCPYCGSDNPHG